MSLYRICHGMTRVNMLQSSCVSGVISPLIRQEELIYVQHCLAQRHISRSCTVTDRGTGSPNLQLKWEVNWLYLPTTQSTAGIHICKLLEGLWVNAINCSEILRQCPYEMSLTGQCRRANFHLWMRRANLPSKIDHGERVHITFQFDCNAGMFVSCAAIMINDAKLGENLLLRCCVLACVSCKTFPSWLTAAQLLAKVGGC